MSRIKKTTLFILFFLFLSSLVPFMAGKIGLGFSDDVYYTVSFYPLNGKGVKEYTVKSGSKVENVPNPGQKSSGIYFGYWADENGEIFDADKAIEKDTKLYARYSIDDTFLLTEYLLDYTEEETSLLYLNGKDNVNTVNDPTVVENLEIDPNGYSVYYVHSYGFVKYPSVRFKSGISVKDVENIVFRLYVHLWNGNYDVSEGGFAIAGINATGIEGECITIDSDIVQDRWIDFTLNRYQASVLADENGIINGFATISNFKYDSAHPNTDGTGVYVGGPEYKDGGYVKIDYVGFTEKAQDSCLLTVFTDDGVQPQFQTITIGNAPQSVIPTKPGYEFVRWINKDGESFDFSSPLHNDEVVYAEYVKSGNVVTVTFDDKNGNTVIREIAIGGKAERPDDPVRAGHDFVCWVDGAGRRFDFDRAISDDTVLYASYVKNTGNVLTDFDADFYAEDSMLTSLNGYTDRTLPLSDPYIANAENNLFEVIDGAENYAMFRTICWGFVKYPALRFASVDIREIRCLKIRVLVHLNDGRIDTRYGGFAFSSVASDGGAGTCYQLDADIEQDVWTDIIISQADAAAFADGNGMISGISVISNFKYNQTVNPTTDGSGTYVYGYVLIDSVSFEERQENDVAVYIDELNGNPKAFAFIEKGDKVSVPDDPERTGYTFAGWVDENGEAFDFSKSIYRDTVIYARYKKESLTVLSDFCGDYEITATSLTALNGNTNVNTGNDPLNGSFTVYNDNGVTYAKYNISSWGFIKYPSVKFAGVHTDSVKYLKIRIFVHINDGKIDNRYGGFAFAGITSEGKTGECYTLAADIVQDEWVEINISPFDLGLFADSDGYIKGLAVIANFKYHETINPTTDGSGVYPYGLENPDCGYVLIDYVAYETRAEDDVAVSINRCNGSATEVLFKSKGDMLNLSETPVKDGCVFNKWTDSNGVEFDFNAPLTDDVVLFATYRTDDGDGLNILLDFDNDYTVGSNILENINGNNRKENYTRFKIVEIEKPLLSEKSGNISYGVFSTLNYGSVVYPSVRFVSPVQLSDLDYLKIRLYVHLWNGNYDVSTGGFVICGFNATGLKEECYMLAEGIRQDEWIDIILTRSQAALFADDEGKIEGISIGSMFRYDPNNNNTGKGVYVGSDGYGGYVLIDYIAYKETENNSEVLKCNVTFNGYSEEHTVKVNVYDKISAPEIAPVKNGYKFVYWAYKGVKFDFGSSVVFGDMELDPVFVYDERTTVDYVGAYTLNGKTIVLNSDGMLKIYVAGKLYTQESCIVLSNGNILINDSVFAQYDVVSDNISVAGNVYARGGGTLIYFNLGDGNEDLKTAVFGNLIVSLPEPQKDGYVFVGWYKDGGFSQKVNIGDEIVDDTVVLYAKYTDNIVTVTMKYTDTTGENETEILVERGQKLTVDFIPQKENCRFVCWVLKNGEKYDFNSAVTSSFTLYARYEELAEYLTVADADLKNQGTLEMFDGIKYKKDSGTDKTNFVEIERVKADGAINGYAYKTSFHSWAITVSENYISFKDKVKVDDIDGLTVRLYAYLSSSSKYDTQSGGIKFYGLGYTGKAGEGLMLPESVKQNEWFDFVISKNDCYKLANSEGYIEGIQIGAGLFIADENLGYEGVGMMYIMIDYVSITEILSIDYVTDGRTYSFEYCKGTTLEKNYFVPEKTGYMFAGWEDGDGNTVSKDTLVTEDCVYYAKWIEKKSLSQYYGYYVNEQGNVIVIGDSISVKGFSVCDDICVNDGKVYILYCGTIYTANLADYHKAETVSVTYDYGFGKVTREYPKNTFVQPLDLSDIISGFNGYVDTNGSEVDFREGFDTDVIVYAVINGTESSDYTRYVGWYKCGDTIIKLTADKKLDLDGTVTGYTVSDGILTFTLNGKVRYAAINANGLLLDGKTYLKLSDVVIISFATGGICREPEKIEIYLSEEYVMQTELKTVSADGYEFLGWYTENGEKVENYSVFYKSAELYARWQKTATATKEPSSGCGGEIGGDMFALCCAAVVSFGMLKRRRKR